MGSLVHYGAYKLVQYLEESLEPSAKVKMYEGFDAVENKYLGICSKDTCLSECILQVIYCDIVYNDK
jgi:hypothetical protein